MIDYGQHILELIIVCEDGVSYSTIIDEKTLRLLTFIYYKSRFNLIVNNQVSTVTLTIILRIYQIIQCALPVLLEDITLLGNTAAYSSCVVVDVA